MNALNAGTILLAGRSVPRLGYGTMRLPGPGVWGPPADRAEALRVLRRAVELGVRVVDTAWYYGLDVANELLAAALRPYPDDLVIVTKLGGARRDDGSWHARLDDAGLRDGCERDLRVLGLDSIPLTHLRWGGAGDVPFEAALGTMLELQREGKIRHIGVSNVSLDQLEAALRLTPIASVSNAYSVFARADEAMVTRCEREGIAYLPFFPLAAGRMGGQAVAVALAARRGATTAQVALAWLLARSPALLPIPGTGSVAHLEENLAAADLELTAEEMRQLDREGSSG